MLRVREVSELLKVPEKKIYRWIKRGILRANRVNHQYRLHRSDLLECTTSHAIDLPVEIFAGPGQGGAPRTPLVDGLRAGGISYGLPGDDKPAILRALLGTLALHENSDRESLYEVLLAREALGSTGIGDGIAIPHVRRPILLNVSVPAISLCFLERPVDFGAFDGKPVFAIFLLISPTLHAHLHLLSRLSFVLQDSELKAAIENRAAPEKILAELERVEIAITGRQDAEHAASA